MYAPEQREYDLEGAVDYVGPSDEALARYLHRVELKLAVSTEDLGYVLLFSWILDVRSPPTLRHLSLFKRIWRARIRL